MFIPQTTTAILIVFLAILAYSEVRNRLAKGKLRRKDLESPGSPTRSVTNDAKSTIQDDAVESLFLRREDKLVDGEMESHKQLYFKLHNLEHHPDILPECHDLLLGLLSSTIMDAVEEPNSGILSVERFSHQALTSFLKTKDVDVTNRWEDYLARRKDGGAREMFSDKVEAQWWLKQAAPVKYVDGAWLGHINKISTPFMYRRITKNAWQVMSEELGDGDLAKNHVHVYRNLMDDISAGLPAADSADFIHPRHALNEARCWKAALAQLTISLFPNDFLPEALGFNMAYESLPLHLLKTVKELRELRLNPYYFELHISIDNADSGHAAMAMAAVNEYIDLVEQHEGAVAAHVAWKRVQAGYILAEGLPTTPESPSLKAKAEESFRRTGTEKALLNILAAKTFVAHKIHCNSRLKIGRRSLVDWLEPNAFANHMWQKDFLHDLSKCTPWVIRGYSEKSRLVKELSWEGKMFGSFTQAEVDIVKAWIDEQGSPIVPAYPRPEAYFEFTGRSTNSCLGPQIEKQDVLINYPVYADGSSVPAFIHSSPHSSAIFLENDSTFETNIAKLNLHAFLPLWFASTTLLESLPSVPVRAANTFGSAIVRVLRAQTGFGDEGLGVAGMDEVRRTGDGRVMGLVELGLEMCKLSGLREPKTLKEAIARGNAECIAFAEWMVHMSLRWLTNCDILVGMAWAFMEMHEAIATRERDAVGLSTKQKQSLEAIAIRERRGLEVCRSELGKDAWRLADFQKGVAMARIAIGSCS